MPPLIITQLTLYMNHSQYPQQPKHPIQSLPHLLLSLLILCSTIYYSLHKSNISLSIQIPLPQFQYEYQLASLPADGNNYQLDEQEMRSQCVRPVDKSTPITSKFKPTPTAYFAYCLHEHPTSPILLKLQHQHYNNLYKTTQYPRQLPICIISTGRNLLLHARYRRYLHSIARQQYGNYRVVLVDDVSDDGTVEAVKREIRGLGLEFAGRVRVVEMGERGWALAGRDRAIRECGDRDVVVELDSDDQFIGTQVLKTINAIYSADPQIWVMYSSYIFFSPTHGEPSQGISAPIPIKILKQNSYRETTQWYTSATRTYRKELYTKIDKNDFKGRFGQFHKWTSDLFVHYSLVQMAGLRHYRYVHQVFYFYNRNHNSFNKVEKAMSRLDALMIRPYLPLNSLEDEPKRDPKQRDYQWIHDKKKELYECSLRFGQNGCDELI